LTAHPDFRLFLSAEPAKLPVNLLQVSSLTYLESDRERGGEEQERE